MTNKKHHAHHSEMALLNLLANDEAYAIASAWHEVLQCRRLSDRRVRLHVDPFISDEFSLVKSYEWISFDIKENQELAASARAASSRGSGCRAATDSVRVKTHPSGAAYSANYSACAAWRPPALHMVPDLSITDATAFFTHHEFPCVRLCTDNAIIAQIFMGMRAWPPNIERDSTIRNIYERLLPYVDNRTRRRRVISVGILEDEKTNTACLRKVANAICSGWSQEPLPRFEYHSIMTMKQGLATREKLASVFGDTAVHIPSVDCGPHHFKYLSRRDIALRLRSLMALGPSQDQQPTVHTFSIGQFQDSKDARAAVWSVIPHSRAITTLRLFQPRTLKEAAVVAYSRTDWAWLGYALFHPQSVSTTWKNLDLKLHTLPVEALGILQLMARGNNFQSVLRNSATGESTVYHRAVIREGARVGVSASGDVNDSWVRRGDMAVDLLAVAPIASSSESAGPLRAMIPGLEFGWIKSSDIVAIESAPAGSPFLKKLKLHVKAAPDPSLVATFVGMVGACLTHLDIGDCGEIDANHLQPILVACPRLQSLRVTHDGSLFTKTKTPELQELSLVVNSDVLLPFIDKGDPNKSPLHRLKTLRIYTKQPLFQRYRDAITTFLLSHPNLQYLHWSDQEYREHNVTRAEGRFLYVDAKQRIRTLLGDHAMDSSWLHVAKQPLSRRPQAAWLSVIRRRRDDDPCSPLGKLHRDLSLQILEFAADSVHRTVWIGA